MIHSTAMAMYWLGYLYAKEGNDPKREILLDIANFLSRHANEINDEEETPNSPLPDNG